MDDCLLRAVFFINLTGIAHIFVLFGAKYGLCINLAKNGLGHILGDFFKNSAGHPGGHPGNYPNN
jgi:hypothetical protein